MNAPTVIAALPDHPQISETISFQLSGLIVVFLVLGSIWFLLEILGKIFALRAKSAAPAAKTTTIVCPGAPASATPSPTTQVDSVAPEIVALIAAAVHLTVGAGHRIVAISPVPHNAHWAMEGRRQIFASHRPR